MKRKWMLLLSLLAIGGAIYYVRSSGPTDNGNDLIIEKTVESPSRLTSEELVARYLVASIAGTPGQGFPGILPWEPLRYVGEQHQASLEDLLREKRISPIEFLEICLKQYQREVHGYRLTFLKRERIDGTLHAAEKLVINYRETPFSVHMRWLEGTRLASKTLYVEGQNGGKLLARPSLVFLPVMARDVDGWDARKSGRFTIKQFGLAQATERVIASMRKAEKAGTLHVRYDGIVKVDQLGDRPCYKLVRTPYDPPEEDDLHELTLYIDTDTLLQVGSILRDTKNQMIAEYFFRSIEINPTYDAKQFTREGM